MAEKVSYQARTLSGGTMARLIGSPKYDDIDHWRHLFHMWCLECEGEFECWQDAWSTFGRLHSFDVEEPKRHGGRML